MLNGTFCPVFMLHVPYLEMSDKDQISRTLTYFHAVFESGSRVFAMEVYS